MSLIKIIKNALTISIISIISTLSSHAQNAEDREALKNLMNEENIIELDKRRIATKFDLRQIELALSQRKYDVFFDAVMQVKADDTLLTFLESKIHTGHIPLYWILADIHSKNKNGLDAHKWLYSATIMTEQDVQLCGDKNLEGYTKKILRSFPETIYYTRGTPYYIEEAMRKTYDFIINIKERQPPDWICNSVKKVTKGKKRAKPVHRSKWEKTRMDVLQEYAGNYKPKITSQDIFKELEEKERIERELEKIEQQNKKLENKK